MTLRSDLMKSFRGSGHLEPAGTAARRARAPLFLPDLTLWHAWHRERGTLPAAASAAPSAALTDVARALGLPIWAVVRPWRVHYEGIDVVTEHNPEERITRYRTPHGTLTARWTLGPDGDWWQLEYPVRTMAELPAARAVAEARTYRIDDTLLDATRQAVGEDGVVAIELPMRPFPELLHVFLGWSDGLLLAFGEGRQPVAEMAAVLEEKLRALVAGVAELPGDVLLAPDNLDGQYISPRVFRSSLAESYGATAEMARRHRKPLIVHVGATARRLLPLLAAAGADGVEGIAGPPQGDATLEEARAAAGPGLALWGGIPQDLLVSIHARERFEEAVREAARQAAGDPRMVVGVADRVPVDAELDRLLAIPALIAPA